MNEQIDQPSKSEAIRGEAKTEYLSSIAQRVLDRADQLEQSPNLKVRTYSVKQQIIGLLENPKKPITRKSSMTHVIASGILAFRKLIFTFPDKQPVRRHVIQEVTIFGKTGFSLAFIKVTLNNDGNTTIKFLHEPSEESASTAGTLDIGPDFQHGINQLIDVLCPTADNPNPQE